MQSSCPPYILDHFTLPAANPADEEYCGPYNALLNHLFPPNENFLVQPLFKIPNLTQYIDFPTIYVVEHKKHPVFILQVKPARHIENNLHRRAADKQMRKIYRSLVDRLVIHTLHGASALGTQLAFYQLSQDDNELEPEEIPKQIDSLIDTAPKARWNTDLRIVDHYGKLEEIVNHIKEMCEA